MESTWMGMRRALIEWYGPRRHAYPWRRDTRDVDHPYRVLVSEVMLQQTQASRVVPAFRAFVRRFPDVRALASAPRRDVLRAWDGLGYNRRAVALSEAARAIIRDHEGRVPSDPRSLEALPGVGPYTAAAVASIAHGVPIATVDTNVRRVISRVFLGAEAGGISSRVRELAGAWLHAAAPGAWNQALMDLGREVCQPKPRCRACPLAAACRFRIEGGAPQPARRRQANFEGSFRQVRGGVLRVLRERERASLGTLAREVRQPIDRVSLAVAALASDGLVQAGPAALAGSHRGVVRLPE